MTTNYNDLYDHLFKIIIIGDSGTGKTSILNRYTHKEFRQESKTTIGVELSSSMVNIDEKRIRLAIWDTAGQDRYRAATHLNAVGAFIVFDLTSNASFNNVKRWLDELKEFVDNEISLTLVGNKSDLRHLRAVSNEDAIIFAYKNNMNYIETSALNCVNIEKAFHDLALDIFKRTINVYEEEISINNKVSLMTQTNEQKCCKIF